MINNFQASSLLASLSLLQSTGSVSVSSQVPSWKAAPPPCTCATTCWSWPEASLPSPSATGNCRRCVDMARCQMASFLRGGLAADTVSNLWTERVFQMYEFRHCSQNGQHLNTCSISDLSLRIKELLFMFSFYTNIQLSDSKTSVFESTKTQAVSHKTFLHVYIKGNTQISELLNEHWDFSCLLPKWLMQRQDFMGGRRRHSPLIIKNICPPK